MAIVIIIIDPPKIVCILGSSFITSHTQIGPKIVSNIKKSWTSCAGIYLGANVSNVNERNTQKKDIKRIKYKSKPIK